MEEYKTYTLSDGTKFLMIRDDSDDKWYCIVKRSKMKDKCVVCKKDSHHNKDEHIKVRIGYIEKV